MVRTTPDLVHNLYFDALISVLSGPLVPSALRRRVLRHFWRAIVVECLAKGRIAWAVDWGRKIRSLYPHDFSSVLIPGIFLATGTLTALVLRRLVGRMFGISHLRVLHER